MAASFDPATNAVSGTWALPYTWLSWPTFAFDRLWLTSLEEDAVIEFCALHLARYKCPQKVNFVEQLPVNTSGKVLRRALR